MNKTVLRDKGERSQQMNKDEIKETCANPFKGKRYSSWMEHKDDGKYVLYEDAMREINSWARVCTELTKEKYELEANEP